MGQSEAIYPPARYRGDILFSFESFRSVYDLVLRIRR